MSSVPHPLGKVDIHYWASGGVCKWNGAKQFLMSDRQWVTCQVAYPPVQVDNSLFTAVPAGLPHGDSGARGTVVSCRLAGVAIDALCPCFGEEKCGAGELLVGLETAALVPSMK